MHAAAAAIDRYVLPAGPTVANPPQAAVADEWDRQTDIRTDTVPFRRPCFAYNACSANYLFLRLGLFYDGYQGVDLVERHLLGGVRSLHQFHALHVLQRLRIAAQYTWGEVTSRDLWS